MIRKWKVETVRFSDVLLDDKNPRSIQPKAMAALKASMSRFGMVELIVWNKRTKHIVSGHQRYSLLVQQGHSQAPMIVVDMAPDVEVDAAITMNNPSIEGEFDEPISELLSQVEKSSPDLFSAMRMDDLKTSIEKDLARNEKKPKTEKTWDTECPCCKNRWMISEKDVVIVRG